MPTPDNSFGNWTQKFYLDNFQQPTRESHKTQGYDITIRDKDRETLTFHGVIYSGSDRMYFYRFYTYEHSEDEAREMIAKGGEVSFYIEERERRTTSYLFTVDCTGFDEAYKLLG